MPVNVGTVEAVLAARDTMTPTMVQAAEKVVVLTNAVANLGTESVKSFKALEVQLEAAEDRFSVLTGTSTTAVASLTAGQAAALSTANGLDEASKKAAGYEIAIAAAAGSTKKAAESMEDMDEKTQSAGRSMGQVEGLTTRLIERLIILWAVRGAAEFVVDILKSAQAMVQFSQQLDVSIGFLQQVQYAADKTNIPFEKMTSALDNFQKKIADAKPATVDALDSIGLGIVAMASQSNEDRIKSVINAIAAIPDHTTRVKAEMQLLNTDALDPMIMKFRQLSEEFDRAGNKMSEETTRALSDTLGMYKNFFTNWSPIVGNIIDKLQQMAAAAASASLNMLPGGNTSVFTNDSLTSRFVQGIALGGPAVAAQMMFSGTPVSVTGEKRGDINLPPPGPQDLVGEAFFRETQKQIEAYKELDPLIKAHLDKWREEGVLSEAYAAKLGVTTEQYKLYVKEHSNATAEIRREQEASQDLSKIWVTAFSDMEAVGDRGLSAIIDRAEKERNTRLAQQDNMFAAGKIKFAEYETAIAGIQADFMVKRASAESIFAQQQEDQKRRNQDRLTQIDSETQDIILATNKRGLDLKLAQIEAQVNREEWAWKKGYDNLTVDFVTYKDAIVALEEKKDAEQVQAIHLATKQLEETAGPLTGPIKDMPLYKATYHDFMAGFAADLGLISSGLRDFGQLAGGSFKTVADEIAASDRMLKNFVVSLDKLHQWEGLTPDKQGGVMGAIGARLPVALAIGEGALGTYAAANQGGASGIIGGAVSGAATGFEIGTIVPGIGQAMGAAIGAIAGAVMGIIKTIGQPSKDELQGRQIESQFQSGFGIGTFADMQKGIADLYAMAGKSATEANSDIMMMLNAEQFGADQTRDAIQRINKVIDDMGAGKLFVDVIEQLYKVQSGAASVSSVTKILDQDWSQMAEDATLSNGRITDGLQRIIELNDEWGVQSKAIADWQKQQAGSVVEGYNAIALTITQSMSQATQDAVAKLEDTNAKIQDLEEKKAQGKATHSQLEDLTDLYDTKKKLTATIASAPEPTAGGLDTASTLLQGGLAVAMDKGGMSRTQAIASESVALTQLESEYKRLGIAITDTTTKQMFMENDLQVAAPQLMRGIDGLSQSMISLDNLQKENADNFGAQQRAGMEMYTRLQGAVVALGGTAEDALRPMQGYLHAAQDEAVKLGVPLDANTQMLIGQSKQLGIWQDDMRTDSQKAHDDMASLTKAINDLTTALSKLPNALPDPTSGWDRNPTITPHINAPVGDTGPPVVPGGPADGRNQNANDGTNGMHTGGIVGVSRSHQGAVYAHFGLGGDEIPIIAQRGEAMLNTSATSMLGASTVHALNRGDASVLKSEVQMVQFERMANSIDSLRDYLDRGLRDAIYFAARDGYLGDGVRRQ